MASIKAHVYNTETEALQAIETINQGEGIPKHTDSVTRTYTTAQEYEGTFYIVADDVTKKYITEPTTELTINTPPHGNP